MTNLRNTPPPHSPSMGVADINIPSHRERDNNYADIVVQLAPRYRVILCPQGLQWISQQQECSHEGPWRAKSYYIPAIAFSARMGSEASSLTLM